MGTTFSNRRKSPTPAHHYKEVFGILFLAVGVFVSLCLLSYHPTDPAFNSAASTEHIHNLGGVVGAYAADLLFTTLGISAYVMAGIFFVMSLFKFTGRSVELRWLEGVYYILFVLFLATLFHLQMPSFSILGRSFPSGGILGSLNAKLLVHYLNRPGAYLVTLTGLVLFFVLATHLRITALMVNVGRLLRYFGQHAGQWSEIYFQRFQKWFLTFWADTLKRLREKKKKAPSPPKVTAVPAMPEPAPTPTPTPATSEVKIFNRADVGKKTTGEEQLKFIKIGGTAYNPPPISLLDSAKQTVAPIDEEVLRKSAILLEKKLLDYEVEGKVTEIHPGPVITMYEFEPAPGTKVNKIVNLETDLSLTMGGRSVRIVPHLPGKAALGIEIPNNERELVWLKEIIHATVFQKSKSHLTLTLGKDTEGHPMVADLTKMPHLLVAGSTGSGKSVAINAMLVSMLYKSSPEDVRFILVDPKMLELSVYEGIPHLLLPVVTHPKKALAAMRWAVKEMERRYRLLADAGVRNIHGYNEKVAHGALKLCTDDEAKTQMETNPEAVCHTCKLYYLVIIIDELADLMMAASQEFEWTITRLAQMARASGIHLILATQRPSVDVITGLIKANFPARISFKVSAKHDSRTILDQNGAETLLGAGDMLFLPPSASNLIRIHGAFINEEEIGRIVNHLKDQGTPVYDTSILESAKETTDGELLDEEEDELYDQAVQIVSETRQASISMIQRKLRIGYNRAARMIERMEAEGVVSPQEGAKPRQVLVNPIEGNP